MQTIIEKYQQHFAQSEQLAKKAGELFPDGINSDSRYTAPFPIYANKAQGAYKTSIEGHELIDYWAGHGALLFGHAPNFLNEAIQAQSLRGTHYGACHPLEVRWGQLVRTMIPSAERVRFVGSGTEANQLAIQLARSFTGKKKVLAFEGHYHGWLYPVFPTQTIDHTQKEFQHLAPDTRIICAPSDIEAVEKHLSTDPDIACIILEPTGPCSGVVPIGKAFLQKLRALTQRYGVVLIFDEVITGFRVSEGGAQAYYDVLPDLTTLGKIVAGGLSGGAIVGKQTLLELLSLHHPQKTAHYGTFSANPLSAAAGVATLEMIQQQAPYQQINDLATIFKKQLNEIIDSYQLDWVIYGEFSCIKLLIGHGIYDRKASRFDQYNWTDQTLLQRGNKHVRAFLAKSMLLHGVDISLSSVITTAHSPENIQTTCDAFEQSIQLMINEGIVSRNRSLTHK